VALPTSRPDLVPNSVHLSALLAALFALGGCGGAFSGSEAIDAAAADTPAPTVDGGVPLPVSDPRADAAETGDEASPSIDVGGTDGDFHEAAIDVGTSQADSGIEAAIDVRDAGVDAAPEAASDAGADVRPPPNCAHPIDDRWDYGLSSSSTPWRLAFGDPHIDTSANRLVLTYDDVAQRTALVGSYYFSFDLDLDSNVTFYVGISNAWVLHPAIVRSGNEIVLSGAYYSMPGIAPVGSFTGQRLPVGRLRVTMFADAVAKKIALYVVAGNERHASGFVTNDQDVGGVLLIGNNAGAGDGPARVGPLEGCSGLTQGEVTAAYASIMSEPGRRARP
jgi:hypothetical protein